MTKNQRIYRQRRAAGLCVRCRQPAEKSRCPKCMEELIDAAKFYQKKKLAQKKAAKAKDEAQAALERLKEGK